MSKPSAKTYRHGSWINSISESSMTCSDGILIRYEADKILVILKKTEITM